MSDKARDVIADWLCDAARKNGFEHEHGKSTNDYADAILAALAEAGLVIVPREPTELMLLAGVSASVRQRVSSIYRAMVEAANE